MLDHVEPPSLICEEAFHEYIQRLQHAKKQTIDDLFEYYSINTNSKTAWKELAMSLAERHIPAMHFKKKNGATVKWDWVSLFRLYALVNILEPGKKERDQKIYTSLFNDNFIEIARATALKPLVINITPKTLQNKYLDFLKSSEYPVLEKILDKMPAETRLQAYLDIL